MLEPWFSLLGSVGSATQRDQLAAIPILGMPRRTERANDFHRAWRKNLSTVCKFADPLLTMVEEPEGQGLDYLVCKMDPDRPFILRWGRYNGLTIRRNGTQRSRTVQEQGVLFAGCEDADEMQAATLGFTIENDYTEAGIPCWYYGRLVLLRERREVSEFITDVWVYSPPAVNAGGEYEAPAPIVTAREQEVEDWERIVSDIRRRSA
jgi:hypothetical protein